MNRERNFIGSLRSHLNLDTIAQDYLGISGFDLNAMLGTAEDDGLENIFNSKELIDLDRAMQDMTLDIMEMRISIRKAADILISGAPDPEETQEKIVRELREVNSFADGVLLAQGLNFVSEALDMGYFKARHPEAGVEGLAPKLSASASLGKPCGFTEKERALLRSVLLDAQHKIGVVLESLD